MSKASEAIARVLQLRVFLIINLAVLAFLLLSFGRQWIRNASIESEIQALTRQKETLEARNVELLSLGSTIQTQYYLEKEGRLKYGLRKPGEEEIIFTETNTVNPTNDPTATNATATEAVAAEEATAVTGSNPYRWWMYFFDHQQYQSLNDSYGS